MAYAEKRGDYYRARWRGPDGTLDSSPANLRFTSAKDAVNYGRDQEAAIRNKTYVDPRAGQITLVEWVNLWYPALDLELNTLDNYRYFIEVYILPAFGHRGLGSLMTEEISAWEKDLPLSRRTAKEARSTLINILNDAIPHYIQFNPAARRRGKGRKGQRRIEEAEKAAKVWADPLQALLVAERAALLTGQDSDFVMNVLIAYTGTRWGEALGLPPDALRDNELDIHWKLYELNGRFYRGRPKDGSMRTADLPPFLQGLLTEHLATTAVQRCTCAGAEEPWCPGAEYIFLTPSGAHHRRSNYSARVFRPAADGWYAENAGEKRPKPAMPVLVDLTDGWPGRPVPPWPPAIPGETFVLPSGRGVTQLVSPAGKGRCTECGCMQLLRINGHVINHSYRGHSCPGGGKQPGEDPAIACWLPILPNLTPHGLRHGHQTMMDEAGIRYGLSAERMGHEVPGMRGTYGHVSPAMRAALIETLQTYWEESLRRRAELSPRSLVPTLDGLLRAVAG